MDMLGPLRRKGHNRFQDVEVCHGSARITHNQAKVVDDNKQLMEPQTGKASRKDTAGL